MASKLLNAVQRDDYDVCQQHYSEILASQMILIRQLYLF